MSNSGRKTINNREEAKCHPSASGTIFLTEVLHLSFRIEVFSPFYKTQLISNVVLDHLSAKQDETNVNMILL